MLKRGLSLLAVLVVISICIPATSNAQWVENGTAVCTAFAEQDNVCTVPDGEGGAFIAWRDYRAGGQIYIQHIDAAGYPMWPTDGISVSSAGAIQTDPQLAYAGDGSVLIAWRAFNSDYDTYAQKIDGDGNKLWGSDGIVVCAESVDQTNVRICRDHAGGAVVAWTDTRNTYLQVYAMRINAAGSLLWAAGGLWVTYVTGGINGDLDIASDGYGGAYATWTDVTNYDVWMEWIHPNGYKAWGGPGGIVVYSDLYTQFAPHVIADGGGGAIVAWEDYRSGNWDIYAQKMNSSGFIVWNSSGVAVCSLSGDQSSMTLIPDGINGAILTWKDDRGDFYTIFAQRVNSAGIAQWAANGISVCAGDGSQYYPVAAADGTGGAIISWMDYRSYSSTDVYAARIDADGNSLWDTGCIPVCTSPFDQHGAQIAVDDLGNSIIGWMDDRDLADGNIYAQRIDRYGKWGFPAPDIASVRDIPGDQGGEVNISWNASRLDVWPNDEISYYSIWRSIDEELAMAMLNSGAVLHEADGELVSDPSSPLLRRTLDAGEPYYWTEIATVFSSEFTDFYAEIVPTLFDSSAAGFEHHYFQIIAHGLDPSHHWISPIDSGYSVDNLAPAAPLGLAGEQFYSPEGLQVTWDPNSETDLAGYNIYRGTSSGFTPGPGSFVTSTPDTATFDGDWSWEAGYWYKVAAVDIHGNESVFALLAPDMLTGDDPMPLPDVTFLAQNFPNPFNPITTIAFGIKESGYVSLRIYDAAGRLVTTLVDESRPAGRYTTEWNGRGADGRAVSSGVYFYRLNMGEFKETKKMILLR